MDKGGPAFPSENDRSYFHGMYLRDYFAAKALPMMSDFSPELGAIEAYKWADAMLKAREQ